MMKVKVSISNLEANNPVGILIINSAMESIYQIHSTQEHEIKQPHNLDQLQFKILKTLLMQIHFSMEFMFKTRSLLKVIPN